MNKREAGRLGGITTRLRAGSEGMSERGKLGGRPSLPTTKDLKQQSAQLGDIKRVMTSGGFPYYVIYSTCEVCGKKWWTTIRKGQPKFKKCLTCVNRIIAQQHSRENHPQWRGGQHKDGNGYVVIHMREHPFADSNGYVKRSRLVIEELLGEYKPKDMDVHHINGIKDDDRSENLMLLTHREHILFHKRQQSASSLPNEKEVGLPTNLKELKVLYVQKIKGGV